MAKLNTSISILEDKASEYRNIVFRGRNVYHDPEDQMMVYESMAQDCEDGAEALRKLQAEGKNG